MSKLYDDNPNQIGDYMTDYSTGSSDNKTKSAAGVIGAVSAGINAVTGLGSFIDTITGGADHRARKNLSFQTALNDQVAEANYMRNLRMWNTQNQYDLPVNQMERYQNASINPNSVISGVTGNSPATMTGADPTSHAPDYNAARAAEYSKQQMLMQTMQQMANINLTNAQADNLKSDTKNKDIQNDFLPQLLQNQVDVGFTQIELNESTKNLTDEQVNNVYQQSLQIQETMKQIREQTNLIKKQIDSVDIKTKLDFQQYLFNEDAFVKLLKKYDLDNNLTEQQIKNMRAATAYLWSQYTGQNLQNTFQRQLNEFGKQTFTDKVSMFKTNRFMLSDQYHYNHINLKSLSKLVPFNNYLDTFDKGATVIRNYLGIAGDILSIPGKVVGSIFE